MSQVDRKVLVKGILRDENTRQKIENAILQGDFTPFFGAGASSLHPWDPDLGEPKLEDTPWKEIWQALTLIAEGLERPEDRHYLGCFAVQRLRVGPRRRDELLMPGSSGESGVVAWPGGKLLEFQRAIVRFAAEFSKRFGECFAELNAPVARFSDFAIEIVSPPELPRHANELLVERRESNKLLVTLLLSLVDAAKGVPTSDFPAAVVRRGHSEPRRLKGDEVYERLLLMAYEMLSAEDLKDENVQRWRLWHTLGIQKLPEHITRSVKRSLTLRAGILEWLPDLLWYSVRFWSPCLPTTAEMAFDLSLLAVLASPSRVELAQAAEAIHWPERVVREVRTWFKYCHDCRSALNPFYVAVAAVLQHSYDLYRRKLEGRSREYDESERPSADTGETEAFAPLVFTTNFDRCLEMVFREMGITYHVLYPVRKTLAKAKGGQGESAEGPQVRWRFCTRYADHGPRPPYPEFLDRGQKLPHLIGPLIRSSPLKSREKLGKSLSYLGLGKSRLTAM